MTRETAARLSTLRPIPLQPLPERPLVSVLLANCNYEKYLPKAVESVIRQTYDHWELIVCDDGSTDQSREVIDSYTVKDSRITLLTQGNQGQASALNRAYRASRGAIISILDADDEFRSTKLACVVGQLTHRSDAGLLVHAMTLVDGDGSLLHRIPILGAFEEGWIADRVLQRGGRWRYMPSSGLVFRRELAEIGFPIPPRAFAVGADSFLFTLFPLLTKATFLAEELSVYRIHGQNLVGRSGVDAVSARNGARLMTEVVQAVNQRLAELALSENLRVEDNLFIAVDLLIAHLLEGEPRLRLYKRYAATARAMLSDDLYGVRQKLLLPFLFGCAAVLPRRWRAAWLNLAISTGTLKRTFVRMITGMRRPLLSPDIL